MRRYRYISRPKLRNHKCGNGTGITSKELHGSVQFGEAEPAVMLYKLKSKIIEGEEIIRFKGPRMANAIAGGN